MWIVIIISFIMYGIFQLIGVSYFFASNFFRKHESIPNVFNWKYSEEEFFGTHVLIKRRPVILGSSSVLDYHFIFSEYVMHNQNGETSIYQVNGAFRYLLSELCSMI